MLTDLKPVDTVGNLAVLARLLDSWTEVGVSQRDAALVAARRIDNLPGRNGTVRVDPAAPPPTVWESLSSRPDHAGAAGRYEDTTALLTVGGLRFSIPALSLEVKR